MKNNRIKNENGKGLLIAIIIILVIAIAAGVYLFISSSNPQKIFVKEINKTVDTLKSGIDQKQEKVNTTISFSGKVETQDASTSSSAIQAFNDTKIK